MSKVVCTVPALGASAHSVGEAHDSAPEDARVRELEVEIEPVVGEDSFAPADDDGKLNQIKFVDHFVLEQPGWWRRRTSASS